MKILSHRGYWEQRQEKNSLEAMKRSFAAGFGVETDVRDRNGQLVISHDPPGADAYTFSEFLELRQSFKPSADELTLALNIKADGLQSMLKQELQRFNAGDYFFFDMSIPDTLGYAREELQFYTRQSEYEPGPALYEQAKGVWLDMFQSDWPDEALIQGHWSQGKMVCVVSPELHGRDHHAYWALLKDMGFQESDLALLCTDFPEEARGFFE
ncbi:MAG: hypothetical protein KDK33_15070 [Leptospiraceae bacterium]|nr:hypothetical protein [Leptospiraceae bacterium]